MQYFVNQNSGHTPKLGSRHDVRYIKTSKDSSHHSHHSLRSHSRHGSKHGSRHGSQELLEQQPMMKDKNEFHQVVGLMDKNLEALMVRDHTLQSASRRASAIPDDDSRWQQRGPKPNR